MHKPPAPRKEHRLPTDVVPRHYDVELRPDLQAATFAATLAVRVDITSPTRTVELNAVELQVQTANIVCGVSTTSTDDGRMKGTRLQRPPDPRPPRLPCGFGSPQWRRVEGGVTLTAARRHRLRFCPFVCSFSLAR